MKHLSKNIIMAGFLIALILLMGCKSFQQDCQSDALKNAFKDYFLIGTAMNTQQITGTDLKADKLIKQHFNSITAENCMKSGILQPAEGVFDFTLADKFIEYGESNSMHIVGHTLIWHSQAPSWFFEDDAGNDVSREIMIERMKNHILTVVGRYKGKVYGWDVVNEAIEDDGTWRKNKFYQIIGEDYVSLAFQFAHQADSSAELYYNDFNMAVQSKREEVVKMVRNLIEKGIKIDGIGMQGHVHLPWPSIEEFENSILAFSALGLKVMITEMDMSVLPIPKMDVGADVNFKLEYHPELNPYPQGLPDSVYEAFQNRYLQFFKLFLKHHEKIDRVTTWGVHDGQSWLNNWPVYGRTNYPLLFDRNYKPKPVVQAIIDEAIEQKKTNMK